MPLVRRHAYVQYAALASFSRECLCGANFLLHNHRALTAEIVGEVRHRGFGVWAWSPNEAQDMRRVVATGADGITPNFPDVLGRVLAESGR